MSDWTVWQFQFDQVFDGAYRYLDRCDEFMSIVREKHGFMPTSVNPNGCDMESPEFGLRLHVATNNLVLTCVNPAKRDAFTEAADFCGAAAVGLFEPFSIHYGNRTGDRSIGQLRRSSSRIIDLSLSRRSAICGGKYRPF